ncbi:hypothetical protein B0J15DRAFT_569053 [Fusarium solani]|uniref:Uncharacterized protein n=1 Tax=Fusarium solani TaxID=169388 RepID=A0A9P9GJI5_FUSSL|nr:uncharacterized protein B0J15DRAFT_569053 [Fusarium solani]KAH7239705.1 hypothetical protein B0J15DRAFT_569053 [Fusarium solani]
MTTISHLIEMAAMLGLYWKVFDRAEDKYRAEGNGCMLTGTAAPDLGIVFSFQVTGNRKFRETRLIPTGDVRNLCYGVVPTIYRNLKNIERAGYPSDEPLGLGVLQVGSRREIAETLGRIGCNTVTCNFFLDETKNVTHFLPEFGFVLVELKTHGERILNHSRESYLEGKIGLFKALHEAINACDQILTAKNDTAIPQMTQARPGRREVVQDVLRSHIQEFLRLLNRDDDRSSDTDPDWNTNVFPATYRRQESVGDIHEASPEERQDKFMAFYFSTIRPNVSARSSRATDRRSAASATHTGHIFPHVGFSRAKRWADGSGPPSPGLSTIDPSTGSGEQVPPTEAVACQPVEEVSHDAVWCQMCR